jgi:3-oxoacyl-[acyl-carrier-protein] synthase-1
MEPGNIDYINLHGTGTPSNDNAESRAVASVFGASVGGSSTKGATGHSLGAAGALEAVICSLALQHEFAPGGINTREIDPELGIQYLVKNRPGRVTYAMSNSFGFGGTNCSLLLGRAG